MSKKLLKIMFFMLISSAGYGQIYYLQMPNISTSVTFIDITPVEKIIYPYNNDILIPIDGKIIKISLIISYTLGCANINSKECDSLERTNIQTPTKQDTQVQFDIIRKNVEMPLSNGKFIFPIGTQELDNQKHDLLESSNIVKKGDIIKIHAKSSYYTYYNSFIRLNAIIQLETND